MHSSTSTSSILDHAVKIRAKNVELRKNVSQLRSDIKTMEDEMLQMQVTHDELFAQCQVLREKQTDANHTAQLEAYRRQFDSWIQDIGNYLTHKTLDLPTVPATTVARKK